MHKYNKKRSPKIERKGEEASDRQDYRPAIQSVYGRRSVRRNKNGENNEGSWFSASDKNTNLLWKVWQVNRLLVIVEYLFNEEKWALIFFINSPFVIAMAKKMRWAVKYLATIELDTKTPIGSYSAPVFLVGRGIFVGTKIWNRSYLIFHSMHLSSWCILLHLSTASGFAYHRVQFPSNSKLYLVQVRGIVYAIFTLRQVEKRISAPKNQVWQTKAKFSENYWKSLYYKLFDAILWPKHIDTYQRTGLI